MSYPRLRRSRTTLWRIMFATPGPAAVGGQLLWGDIGEPWGKCHKVKSSAVKWHFGVRPHVLRLMITIVPWHQLAESSSMHCSAECPVIPSNHNPSTSESWWLECVKVRRHHGFAETFPNIFHRHVQQKGGGTCKLTTTTIDQHLNINGNGSIDSKAKLHPVQYHPVPIWFSYVLFLAEPWHTMIPPSAHQNL